MANSPREMQFADRTDAGRRLAARLSRYREERPVVFGLPRGGVVVAYQVAVALGAPLDVVTARKIGTPEQPELGMGAIAPGGVMVLDDRIIGTLNISPHELEQTTIVASREMARRNRLFRGDRPWLDVTGKSVILVDDGLATGVTARAAITCLRRQKPARLVFAVPVGAAAAVAEIRPFVDELVCLATSTDLRAVSMWYADFDQTTDDEVLSLLARSQNNDIHDNGIRVNSRAAPSLQRR